MLQFLLLRRRQLHLPLLFQTSANMSAPSGNPLIQLFALKGHSLVVAVLLRMLAAVAETEGKCAGGRHAQVEVDLLRRQQLHHLLLLLLEDVQLVPMETTVYAVVPALTVESPQDVAAFDRRMFELSL